MKRLFALLLCCALLFTGCASGVQTEEKSFELIEIPNQEPSYSGYGDPVFLQDIEDSLYAELEGKFGEDQYRIESISSAYVSKEYLDELAYNSQSNIFFGYTLAEIDAQFEGERYVFSLSDSGETVVKAFEAYDDTFDQVLKNVAIGAGVILVCVTAKLVCAKIGLVKASSLIAIPAKEAMEDGVEDFVKALLEGVYEGAQSGDMEKAMKDAMLKGTEDFKWGALSGFLEGGLESILSFKRANSAIPSPKQAEENALKQYGGEEQLTYLNGKEVPWGTPGGTRPDIVRTVKGHLEAIEVKNYDLSGAQNRASLYSELKRQVSDRLLNMPKGSTQRIVLNTEGRNYSKELLDSVVLNIKDRLKDIYPDIPVEIMR